MAVNTTLNLSLVSILSGTDGAGGSKPIELAMRIAAEWATGTSAFQGDRVYARQATLAASTLALDLRGGAVNDEYGSGLSMVEIIAVGIRNLSTTTNQPITVTSTIPWIGGNLVIGPSGGNFYWNPLDGVAVTAGTGDTITFDPGANTISADVIVIGRSA